MKNLVVCCDGTGQKLDIQQTNVVRLLRLVDQSSTNAQVAYYDAGLGTTPDTGAHLSPWWKAQRLAGLAFGWGLGGQVASAYRFVVDRYEPGDALYLFGFSRGAFTIRVVAGLLHRLGVLRPEAKNLIPYALELYKEHDSQIIDPGMRERLIDLRADFRSQFSRPGGVDIEFLGVWDTVKAFGVLRPRSFPHTRHNPSVKRVRHALSLDERRRSFQVTTWGGLDGFVEQPADQDVEEVWFGGDHSDVGGGHKPEESGLSWLSFDWMLGELREYGCLRLDPARIRECDETRRKLKDGRCFMKRHDLRGPGWCVVDCIPRHELANAPKRDREKPVEIPKGLSVPFGWPRHPLRYVPTTGARHFEDSRRNEKILVHESVRDIKGVTNRSLAGIEGITYVKDKTRKPC
jgi:uncharacterized protein (DUF2235 family)